MSMFSDFFGGGGGVGDIVGTIFGGGGGVGDIVGTIFGGGGGGGQSQTSNQSTTVDNKVEVNVDIEKLAKALQDNASVLDKNSLRDIFFKSQLASQDQALKESELKMSALSLEQKMKSDKNTMILTAVSLFIAFLGLFLTFKKRRKN